MTSPLVEVWRKILGNERSSWVLFGHGTVVILTDPEPDLGRQAIELMEEWGPVYVGTPAGDFNVVRRPEVPGWVVTSHHKDILTYVNPDELEGSVTNDFLIGLTGRSKRDQDARELQIHHIEHGTA